MGWAPTHDRETACLLGILEPYSEKYPNCTIKDK